jgi:hypothetical protein
MKYRIVENKKDEQLYFTIEYRYTWLPLWFKCMHPHGDVEIRYSTKEATSEHIKNLIAREENNKKQRAKPIRTVHQYIEEHPFPPIPKPRKPSKLLEKLLKETKSE